MVKSTAKVVRDPLSQAGVDLATCTMTRTLSMSMADILAEMTSVKEKAAESRQKASELRREKRRAARRKEQFLDPKPVVHNSVFHARLFGALSRVSFVSTRVSLARERVPERWGAS